MAEAETVDILELEIKAKAERAASEISNLASSVADFGKNVRRYINNLNDFSSALTAIADAANKLSRTSGLGKVLDKVAPVAAAMKAKMPTASVRTAQRDWRRQMFPNEKDYNAVFQPRGYNAGRAPSRIIRVGNDSPYVMDRNDISKAGAHRLTQQLYRDYNIRASRGFTKKDMDAQIAAIRSGYGRTTGANSAWMTKDSFTALQGLAESIYNASEPHHDYDAVGAIKAIGKDLRFSSDDDMTDVKIGALNREFADVGIRFSKSGGVSIEDLLDMARGYSATGASAFRDEDNAAAIALGLGENDTMNDVVAKLRSARERKEYTKEGIMKSLLAQIADVSARNEREMVDPEAVRTQDGLKEIWEAQKASTKETVHEVATEAKEAVRDIEDAASVKRELDRPQKFSDAEIEQRRKEFAETWNAIEKAANVVDEQKQQASLQRAMEDNTPALIAASRSRFEATGRLETWNEMFGAGIPGLADRGLAAGLIDADTAQAMKDAAAGVQEIGEEANGAKENTEALKDSMEEVAEAEENATTEARSLKDVLKAAGSVIGNSFLGKMSGQIFRVAKMRSLRYIVKEIAAGFKEGTSNLYQWSKGLGGPFAAAMDTIASKAMLAKNSIATAFAPAIQALVPVLNTVVNWINAASNALAQFLALLTGKDSWTAAKESAEDWGDATKGSVGGASKAMKDLLADWDELNIIQSKTGGGGGGGSKKKTTDVSDMFEERFKFDEWTRYFDNIKKIVTAIGAGIAAWFVLDTAQQFLKQLGIAGEAVDGIFSRIKKGVAGAVLLVISYELAEVTGKSIARDGLTLENALTGVGSLLSGALGGYFLASAINPALGVVGAIAGLTMALAVGIKAYVDEKRTMLYEDVDKYLAAELSNVFSFDVDAVVERVNTTVENAEQARKAVHDQLADVLTSVEVLKLGVDEKSTWAEIHDQVLGKDGQGGLLGKIKTSLGEDRNVITLYYETKSREGLEGKNGTTVANGMKTELMANSWLAAEYTRLGKKFGECFNEGEVASIKEGKADAAQAILNTITEAEQAAEKARAAAELNVELKNKMAGLDDGVVMEEMSSIFDEYEQKLAAARKKIAEEHYITLASSLAELKSLGADDALIQSVQTMLDEAQKELDKTDLDWKVDVHAEFADDEKKMFGEELVKRYGPELAQLVSALSGDYLSDLDFLTEVMNKGGYDQFVQGLMQDFMTNLPGEAKKWMQDNGIDVTDFFTDEQKKKILEGRNRIAPDEVEDVVEEIADPLETANKWWDEYRGLMQKQEQNGGLPASAWKTEDELFGDVKMVLGDNFDAFWTSLQEYINGLEDPWSEEDLPSEVVPGGTEAGATAFYTGTPDETFEMDAGGSGLATDDAVNGAAADVTSGMAKLENVMGLVKTAVDLVAEYTRMTANKDFTVTINPSAAFGRVGNTSGRMFGNVTGD